MLVSNPGPVKKLVASCAPRGTPSFSIWRAPACSTHWFWSAQTWSFMPPVPTDLTYRLPLTHSAGGIVPVLAGRVNSADQKSTFRPCRPRSTRVCEKQTAHTVTAKVLLNRFNTSIFTQPQPTILKFLSAPKTIFRLRVINKLAQRQHWLPGFLGCCISTTCLLPAIAPRSFERLRHRSGLLSA